MANLDKLKKNAAPSAERVKIEPTTRASSDAKPKQVILRLPPETHAALRRKTFDEGTSIQQVLAELVEDYISGK